MIQIGIGRRWFGFGPLVERPALIKPVESGLKLLTTGLQLSASHFKNRNLERFTGLNENQYYATGPAYFLIKRSAPQIQQTGICCRPSKGFG